MSVKHSNRDVADLIEYEGGVSGAVIDCGLEPDTITDPRLRYLIERYVTVYPADIEQQITDYLKENQ